MLECNTVGRAINVSHCRANILFKFVPQFNFNEVERKLLRIHYSAEHLERQFAYFALRLAKKELYIFIPRRAKCFKVLQIALEW